MIPLAYFMHYDFNNSHLAYYLVYSMHISI